MRGIASALLLASAALALPAAAQGDQPGTRFFWTRGEGAESCPDRFMIADAVAARLGYS